MRIGQVLLVVCGVVWLGGCFGRGSAKVAQQQNALCRGKEQGSVSSRIRRLSNREYNQVVEDLLGDSSHPADGFLEDTYANGYDNGSARLTVQTDQAVRYQQAAESLAQRVVSGSLERLLGCDPRADQAGCLDALFGKFLLRAYRRPPTAGEVEQLRAVYQYAFGVGGFELGVQTTLEAILQSPQFLYREELGVASADGTTELTDYELASELSFFLTGSMPDEELFQAAADGRLHTPSDLQREGERLLQTPKAKANLRAFFSQWLATNRLTGATKEASLYPSFSPALARSMDREIGLFIDDVVWARSGTLKELFSSNHSFADEALGSLYGVTGSAEFGPVELDSQRQGILTRAGFLAANSGPDSSSPVERGVFVQQVLLCTKLPPPPPDVLQRAMMQQPDPSLTTRERFGQHSRDAFCQGCHRMIDPVGFGFEQFDAIGAYRTEEKGKPVDSSGMLVGTDVDGPFNGVSELSQKLLKSKQFENCVVTQLFRFAMGKGEETTDDSCAISNVSDHFSTEVPLRDALLGYVGSRLFRERTPEQGQ